jgi:membrane associated rhomboid family serine protease
MTSVSLTIIIIIITAVTSFVAFSNAKLIDDLIFYPPAVTQQRQWYRFITCGFIHADIPHLAFNMISLYMFGEAVEGQFVIMFGAKAKLVYLLLYFSALVVCLLPTFSKHKNDYQYKSIGASGAVSAVVFVGILFYPTAKIGIFIIPPIIPGFIFAPIYLFISAYLEKKGADNINHSAHIWGALYGVAFVILAGYFFSDYRVVQEFIDQVSFWLKK